MSGKNHQTLIFNADSDAEYAMRRRELFGAIDRFIVDVYGERCSEVNGGCAACAAWAARDALNATIIELGE